MCSKLKVSQIIKLLNLYTPGDEYEERVSSSFVRKIQAKLQERAALEAEQQVKIYFATFFMKHEINIFFFFFFRQLFLWTPNSLLPSDSLSIRLKFYSMNSAFRKLTIISTIYLRKCDDLIMYLIAKIYTAAFLPKLKNIFLLT